MPASFHPKVIERAKVMWTVEGLSPHEILQTLSWEFMQRELDWTFNLDDTRLPDSRSTINRWADRYGWVPYWGDAKKNRNEELSVFEQVLYHLSKTLAYRKAYEYATEHYWRSQEIDAVVMQIQFDVASEYDPPPQVFRKLRPTLRKKVREEKRIQRIQGRLREGGAIESK